MNKEKEYYVGYLRNPKQKITNGFQDIEEMEVILEKDYNDFRELALREKVYIVNKNQVIDGHKIYKSHAGLVGRVGNKLTNEEAMAMITNIRNNRMREYIEKLTVLINDTLEMFIQGEKEYQEERQKFASEYGTDAANISDKAEFRRIH